MDDFDEDEMLLRFILTSIALVVVFFSCLACIICFMCTMQFSRSLRQARYSGE